MTYVTRLGTGFDVHAFGDGDHVWLGGVRIAHDRGVVAHSDGDVILHALTDAVLGALADGDIGTHFPPSDPQWRGASSDRFLAHAVALGARTRRHRRPSRRDAALRAAEARSRTGTRSAAASPRSPALRIDQVSREGDDDREARFHRPRRGHRRPGGRDDPSAGGLWHDTRSETAPPRC